MKKVFGIATLSLALSVFPMPSAAEADMPAGVYQVAPQFRPASSSGVNQWANGNTYYLCGHAALASTINFLRQGKTKEGTAITSSYKQGQLSWIDAKLEEMYGGNYTDDNPQHQVKITQLEGLMKQTHSPEFSVRVIAGPSRNAVKDELLQTLNGGPALAIALGMTSNGFRHFMPVYKIDYKPTVAGGGTVYYWDPLDGNFGQDSFTDFLDDMLEASSKGYYNFMRVYKH